MKKIGTLIILLTLSLPAIGQQQQPRQSQLYIPQYSDLANKQARGLVRNLEEFIIYESNPNLGRQRSPSELKKFREELRQSEGWHASLFQAIVPIFDKRIKELDSLTGGAASKGPKQRTLYEKQELKKLRPSVDQKFRQQVIEAMAPVVSNGNTAKYFNMWLSKVNPTTGQQQSNFPFGFSNRLE